MLNCVNLLSFCVIWELPNRRMAETIRIGLVMSHSLGFYRGVLRGVKKFAVQRPDWVLTPLEPHPHAIELARPLKCDGYLAHIFTRPLADMLLSLHKPVVSVAGVLPDVRLPRVTIDHEEVGRQAARHMLQRGIRHFGFVGYPKHDFSVKREAGFREVVEAAGHAMATFYERSHRIQEPTGLWRWNLPLMDWLRSLPQPAGVLASTDVQGAQVSEFCRQLKLLVPDQVAIVGVDDDDLLCELSRPSLSSVALPCEQIGYEAARLLDDWLGGRVPDENPLILPPAGVVARQSSDVLAVSDPEVGAAVRYIHRNAHQVMCVADVLRHVPIARRALERRFRRALDRSISQEIRRAHLDRCMQLLIDTELPLATVARMSGLNDGRQLSVLFRQAKGMPPSQFRQQHRRQD